MISDSCTVCSLRTLHSLALTLSPAYQPPCLAPKSLTPQIDPIIKPLAFLSSALNLLHRPDMVLTTLFEVLFRGYTDKLMGQAQPGGASRTHVGLRKPKSDLFSAEANPPHPYTGKQPRRECPRAITAEFLWGMGQDRPLTGPRIPNSGKRSWFPSYNAQLVPWTPDRNLCLWIVWLIW